MFLMKVERLTIINAVGKIKNKKERIVISLIIARWHNQREKEKKKKKKV